MVRRLGVVVGAARPTVTLSGSLAGSLAGAARDSDVVAGGGTLVVHLRGARWHADVGSNSAATTALLAGLASAEADPAGWNAVVTPLLDFNAVTRDGDKVVTITLPVAGGYGPAAGEVVSLAVPPAALAGGEAVAAVGFGISVRTVDRAWAGGLTDTGFVAVVETLAAQTAGALWVAVEPTLTSLVTQSAPVATGALVGADGTYHVARLAVAGLAPGRSYYYGFAINGVPDLDHVGTLRTPEAAGLPTDFRVVFGSCSDPGLSNPDGAFGAIKNTGALMFVHMGDLHYEDIGVDNLAAARTGLHKHTGLAGVASLYRGMPVAYTYDDHDSGPDNNHQGTANFAAFMANTSQAYREMVPHFVLAQPGGVGWTPGVAQAWTLGRVRFLMPDLRVHRAVGAAPGTILGDGRTTGGFASWDQKQWLKSQLDLARDGGIKLVVIVSASVLLSGGGNGWRSHADWISELGEVLGHGLGGGRPELLVVCGDAHATGFDDGGSVEAAFGVRVAHICASPLRKSGASGSGPYRWRGIDTETNNQSQSFVVVDFEDDGGARVKWTATPRAGNGSSFAGDKGGPFSNFDLAT